MADQALMAHYELAWSDVPFEQYRSLLPTFRPVSTRRHDGQSP